jgi:predicted HAD superfamily Cof-like phosphohydrolase
MRIEQDMVFDFHERNDLARARTPRLVDFPLAVHRHLIIKEEVDEYLTACAEKNLVGVADALGDMLYTVLGAAVQHGIDVTPIFAEVHRSNMTKTPLDPVTRKGGKGPGFEPPHIAEILIEHMTRIAS